MPNVKAVTRTRLGHLAPPYWHEAIEHLRSNDPVMGRLIEAYPGSFLRSRGAPYETLMRSIVGQQISVAAANTVWLRLESKLGNPVSPKAALACGESIREVGLSARKAAYLLDLSQWFATTKGLETRLSQMPDHELIKTLVARPGIGPWTADIFIMFCLGRADAWAAGDLALQVGVARAFGRGERLSAEDTVDVAERWRPWRGVAARLIWADYANLRVQRQPMGSNPLPARSQSPRVRRKG